MGGLAFLLLPFLAPVATAAVNLALSALANLNLQIFPTFQPNEVNNYSVFYFEQKVIRGWELKVPDPSYLIVCPRRLDTRTHPETQTS